MKSLSLTFFPLLFIILCYACGPDNNKHTFENSTKADRIALEMLKAINYDAWQKTHWVQWTFADKRHYVWDRKRQFVEIQWDQIKVLYNLNTRTGIVFDNEQRLSQDSIQIQRLESAWSYFCNDEFWLNAPAKLFAEGTTRELIDEANKLKVTYHSGGVTPGDAYVWSYDNDFLPTAYEMYVSIIPEKGKKATWESWKTLHTGALISTEHLIGERTLKISNVHSGDNFTDLGYTSDPFEALLSLP